MRYINNLCTVLICLLVANCTLSCRQNTVSSRLAKSIAQGQVDEVDKYLQDGNSADTILDDGLTLLSECIRYQNFEAFILLINNGALPNKIDQYNKTPAYYASTSDYISFLDVLCENGVDLNNYVDRERSLVHIAARNNDEKLLHWLLLEGIEIDKQDVHGMTAFHYAARYDLLNIAMILIDNGCDTSIEDIDGRTALDHAHEKNNQDIIDLISNKVNKSQLEVPNH